MSCTICNNGLTPYALVPIPHTQAVRCPACGRWYQIHTVTTNTTALTMHAPVHSSGEPSWGEITTPGYNTVPQAFQDAFKDGELEV
jgi:hypothetical protein